MAEINPAVIAGAGSSIAGAAAPDLKQIITMQALAQRMQLLQQEQQGQNALKALYGNPANISPQTGEPTPQAMNQLMSVAPQVGLDFQSTLLKNREAQQRAALLGTKVRDDNRVWALQTIAAPAVARYREVLQATGSKEQAQAAAQQVFGENRERAMADGRLSPDEQRQVPNNFSLSQAETNLLGVQGVRDAERKDRAEARQERSEGRQEDVATSTIQHQRATEEQGRWQVKDDPTTGRPYMLNTKTGETKPVEPPGGQSLAPADAPNVHGEEYLKSLEPNQQLQVKALAEGRMQFPSGFALRTPYWQRMLQQVSQYDPEFNQSDYQARARTRADFTSGKSAQNLTAINTTIGHFGSLLKAGDALNNFRESVLPGMTSLNKMKNWYEASRGDPRIVRFEESKDAVTRELTRVFRGSGGNVADIKDWERSISNAMTPEQLHAGIEQGVELLTSRIDAIGEQYKRGMGRSSDVMDLLTPKAKETLAQLPGAKEGLGKEGEKGGAAAPARSAIPAPGPDGIFSPKSEDDYSALPSGSAFRKPGDPPDKVRIKP